MNIILNNQKIEVNDEMTVLELCRKQGIFVPTLCYLRGVTEDGNCRTCLVEVNGKIKTSCSTAISDGMVIVTNSPKVEKMRKTNIELIISNHNFDCEHCGKQGKCDLQKLAILYNIDPTKYAGDKHSLGIDDSSLCIVKDHSKCIHCGRCIEICNQLHGLNVYGKNHRGFDSNISPAFLRGIGDTACIGCGQCVLVCPTGALMERTNMDEVTKIIKETKIKVIAQVAPSVRVALGEEFGSKMGKNVEAKIPTALRLLGFDEVYDVNVGADLTSVEEAKELIERKRNGGVLPLFTSCCPAWYKYVLDSASEFVPNLSTCLSPNEMLASLVKYKAEKVGEKVKIVSIMPCTAKKYELAKDKGTDYSLTTREIGYLLRRNGIDLNELEDSEFDNPFADYSGSGVIFGKSGGVMESAIRSAIRLLTGKEITSVQSVQESEGVLVTEVKAGEIVLRVAVVYGINNAKQILERIKEGEHFDFVEVMACPKGCINGGGQPYVDRNEVTVEDIAKTRGKSLTDIAKIKNVKNSYNSEVVQKVFSDISAEKLHQLLHHKLGDEK